VERVLGTRRLRLVQGDITILDCDAIVNAANAALHRANEKGLKSIALPAISTGIFGFPLERAAEILLQGAIDHLRGETSLDEVIFCLFSDGDFAMFEQKLQEKLP